MRGDDRLCSSDSWPNGMLPPDISSVLAALRTWTDLNCRASSLSQTLPSCNISMLSEPLCGFSVFSIVFAFLISRLLAGLCHKACLYDLLFSWDRIVIFEERRCQCGCRPHTRSRPVLPSGEHTEYLRLVHTILADLLETQLRDGWWQPSCLRVAPRRRSVQHNTRRC